MTASDRSLSSAPGDIALHVALASLAQRWVPIVLFALLCGGALLTWNRLAPSGYWRMPTVTVLVHATQPVARVDQATAALDAGLVDAGYGTAIPGYAGEELYALLQSQRVAAAVLAADRHAGVPPSSEELLRFVRDEREIRVDPVTALIHIEVRNAQLDVARRRALAHVAIANQWVHDAASQRQSELGARVVDAVRAGVSATEARALTRTRVLDAREAVIAAGLETPLVAIDEVADARAVRSRPDIVLMIFGAGCIVGLGLGAWLMDGTNSHRLDTAGVVRYAEPAPWVLGAKIAAVLVLPPVFKVLRWLLDMDAVVALFAASQAFLLALAFALAFANRRQQFIGSAERAYILFVVLMLLATLLAFPRFPELDDWPMFGPWLMFVMWSSPVLTIPALFPAPGELRTLIRAVEWLGVPLAITVYLPMLGIAAGEVQSSESTGVTRVFGVFGDGIAPVMSLYLVQAVATRAHARTLLYGGALLATVGLGAMMCTAVALLVLFFARGTGWLRGVRGWLGVVTGIALAGVLVAVAGQGLQARLRAEDSLAFSLAQRLGSFLSAERVFENNPWSGVGYTGLKAVALRYRPEDLFAVFSENAASTAANQILQTATDAGVLGVLSLLWMFGTALLVLRRAGARWPEYRAWFDGAFAWGVGMVVGYQTGVWLLPHLLLPFLFFVLVGVALACLRVQRPG